MQRKTLILPHINLSYLESNTGKTPLLLLHGLGDHGLVWSSLGDYLAQDYHVIAPDLRGHGESGKPSSGYTFVEIIKDLQSLMESLGWTSAHILGHSWTGKLAAVWATQYPAQFRSLILVDPFFIDRMPSWIKITFPFLYRVLSFTKELGPFPSYEVAEAKAKKMKKYRGWNPLQQAVFAQGIEQKSDGNWGGKLAIEAVDEVFTDVMEVAGLTQKVNIPSLFIQPEKGLNRTNWQLKSYHQHLTNLQINAVPGNHWAFLEQPEPFNQVVANFLNNLARP